MWLIFLMYLILASTFTLAKAAVFYMKPIYFIAFRMMIAGGLLLGYIGWYKKGQIRIKRADFWLFAQLIAFHIYGAYLLEFWALQYVSSSKAALFYNLSPFITALLCAILFGQQLSRLKWVAMVMGFVGMLPIVHPISLITDRLYPVMAGADLALLLGVACASYGWLLVKELAVIKSYNFVTVNGIGMLGGGIAALLTAAIVEGTEIFIWNGPHPDLAGSWLYAHGFGQATTVIMAIGTMAGLIILANLIGYNLYAFLLARYSLTFLSFAGFIAPFLVGILGSLFLGERLSGAFLISFVITMFSLYLFYAAELQKTPPVK